jgi:type I restriction enzyme S subunit
VTIGKLALFRIEKIEVPVPPIDLQREFDVRVGLVSQVRESLVNASRAADRVFSSLQQQAFAGVL